LSISGLEEADLITSPRAGTVYGWLASVAGLTRLKTKYIIGPLERHVALLTNMAKFAGLPWTGVVGGTVRTLQA
jgi:2-haloacid dehalogenase